MLWWTDPQIAEREFENLLIRVPNPMGDQIMATPALDAVRARYPKARITGHGVPNALRMYEGGAWFDDFITIARKEGTLNQVKKLKGLSFDACLLLSGSFRTAFVPFVARVRHRIGYQWSGRSPLLTASWRRPRPGGKKAPYPTKKYFNDLVAKIGAKAQGRIRLSISDEVQARGDAWLHEHGLEPHDCLMPMCVGAAFGPSKLWPAEYFAQVADAMAERHGMKVLMLCAPGEEAIGRKVRAHAKRPLFDSSGDPLSIDLLKAVIRRSRVLLTNDTGPRHIAAAFRRPIVCLMGPTSPVYTETDNEETSILREEGVECSPCHLKECPIDHRCLVRITPDRALAALEAVLAAPDPAHA